MLIASWNVNSIRKRLSQVLAFLKEKKPDVLCLQETKVIDKDFPVGPFEELGYFVEIYGQKSYNGLAIISKHDFEDIKTGFKSEMNESEIIDNFEDQKRIMSGLINGIRIINVYVPNGSSINSDKFNYKIEWLNQFSKYIEMQEKREEHTCLLGDFNIAPSNEDIHDPEKYKGGIMASELERAALNNTLEGKFIDSFRVFEKILVIGVGGITVIMLTN